MANYGTIMKEKRAIKGRERVWMEIKTISFKKHGDDQGKLVYFEGLKDIPFDIKRIYYIFDVKKGARRGFHAHKELVQVLVCVKGSCKVMLDDGKNKETVLLDCPTKGLVVDGIIWREMYDFSSDAVLLVMASHYYDENDYIRNYDEFLSFVEGANE